MSVYFLYNFFVISKSSYWYVIENPKKLAIKLR